MTKFFAHLHNHFDHSLKDAPVKVSKALKKAKELGYTAYAITDHGTISGWIEFAMYCKELNIKPIFGIEGYEAERDAKLKVNGIDNKRYHSLFLAKNFDGIQALRKLATFSLKRENFYYKARYDRNYLLEHKEEFYGNVIWSSACIGGRLPKLLLQGKEKEAQEYYDFMVSIFGKENCFIEIHNHISILDEERARGLLVNFAKKNNGQLLATNDIHYINKKDYLAREIMIARENGQTIKFREENNKILPSELYIKSKEEMDELFKDYPEALENTKKVVDMIEHIDLEEKEWHYPNFPIPEGETPTTYLKKITYEKVSNKYPINTYSKEEREDLFERIDMELDVIDKCNASAYMLIDADFIVFAKENGIPVGPGRGSACGSVVANIMDITSIDPIPYALFFERLSKAFVKLGELRETP